MKFEAGKTYWTRSICDSECIHTLTVVSRTAKTIKATIGRNSEVKVLRVFIDYNGHEAVKPHGSYSMAAIISADDEGSGPAPKPAASVLKRPTMSPAEMQAQTHAIEGRRTQSRAVGVPRAAGTQGRRALRPRQRDGRHCT